MDVYPLPTLICIGALIAIAIYTAFDASTRFSFEIGAPFLVAYFLIGSYMYKKGKFTSFDYKKYLDSHISGKSIE